MKTLSKPKLVILAAVALVAMLALIVGPMAANQAAVATITVSGTQWGVSTCFLGATEGNVRFNASDLVAAGYNTYRVYGGMSRWEAQDDDGVYGSPTIAQIKADPNVINWAWWDNVMTNPTDNSDYWWSGLPGTTWQGNARTIFQGLKDAGIKPVLTLRNVDNNIKPDWAETNLNPPNTPEDWNEWWEHVFATVYWLNVRNDYHVDDYEVHNEPNNSGQGFNGTITDYYAFVEYTNDAIQYVYATYLPGRTPRVYAPVSNSTSWPRDCMINVGDSFTVVDYHSYNSNISGSAQEVHGYMNTYGFGNAELWLSEWATYRGGYDGFGLGVKTIINNVIRGSQPANDHIDGSHLFTFYDWDGFTGGFQNFEGLVDINGARRNSFYAARMSNRALNGCKPTFQSTSNNSSIMAITSKDASNNVYLLVTNSAASTSYTIDADLSALVSSGTGSLYRFDSTPNLDVITANPTLSGGHVTFDLPGSAAALFVVAAGGGGPTATPPPGPTATPTTQPGGVMHVSNIAMTSQKQGANYKAKATVTIVDANNAPVGTATVAGQFTGATSDTVSGATDASGNVTLTSSAKSGGGTWTFCVTGVTKTGWTYNSSANVETCDTITAP